MQNGKKVFMEFTEKGSGMVHWVKQKFTQVMVQNYKRKYLDC